MHRSASKVTELFPILSTSCNCILQVTKQAVSACPQIRFGSEGVQP